MVRISSSLSAVALSIAPLVSGAALEKREFTWEMYHEQNEAFSRIGRCLVYLEPAGRDGGWACNIYCDNENTAWCQGPEHYTEQDEERNPDGKRYIQGECQCDKAKGFEEVAKITVDFVAQGLDEGFRKLPALACETTLNLGKEFATYGSYLIPGTGQVAAAARTMAKGVKLATKTEGGEDKWFQAVEGACGALDFSSKGQLQESFHILRESPDEFTDGEGEE